MIDPETVGRPDPSGSVSGVVILAVACGGFLGSVARYGLGVAFSQGVTEFPWTTLGVNLSGSLAIGVVLVLLLERLKPLRHVRPFLVSGFVGSYTTFSTMAVEMDLLIHHGHWVNAVAYGVVSLFGGLLLTFAGMSLARAVSTNFQPR